MRWEQYHHLRSQWGLKLASLYGYDDDSVPAARLE